METRTKVSLSGRLGLFEDVLARGADVRVRATGRSMIPFLRGGEMLIIRKVPCDTLKRGDVILFRGEGGVPVIHRVVMRKKNGGRPCAFLTKGDGLRSTDTPVFSCDVLGKVCAVESGYRYRNLETARWTTVNYLFGWISLLHSRLFPVARVVRHAVRARATGSGIRGEKS